MDKRKSGQEHAARRQGELKKQDKAAAKDEAAALRERAAEELRASKLEAWQRLPKKPKAADGSVAGPKEPSATEIGRKVAEYPRPRRNLPSLERAYLGRRHGISTSCGRGAAATRHRGRPPQEINPRKVRGGGRDRAPDHRPDAARHRGAAHGRRGECRRRRRRPEADGEADRGGGVAAKRVEGRGRGRAAGGAVFGAARGAVRRGARALVHRRVRGRAPARTPAREPIAPSRCIFFARRAERLFFSRRVEAFFFARRVERGSSSRVA